MALEFKKYCAQNNWPILFLIALTFAITVSIPLSSVPVLLPEISRELNLNSVQVGSLWGIIALAGIITVPIGGILCDSFGVKRTLIFLGLFSGITGATRAFSNELIFLMSTTFLWGLSSSAIMPVLSIAASQSAGRLRQGSVQGWISVGGGIGFILGPLISATWLSPLLGGWRNVFLTYGIMAILISLFWLIRAEERKPVKQYDSSQKASLRQRLVGFIKNKNLWLIGVSLLAYQGCVMGMQGFLPYYLEGNGWSIAAAGGALAAYSAVGTIGVVPLTTLSDKIGSRKICLLMSFIVAIIGVGLMSVIQNWALWILVILVGIFSQMNSSLFATMSIETTQNKPGYSGTAVGFVLGCGLIGRSLAPPIGNSLAAFNNSIGWPFIFWSALAVAGTVILFLVKENNPDKHRANSNE